MVGHEVGQRPGLPRHHPATARLLVEDRPEAGADECLVVGDEYPDHVAVPFVGSHARTWYPLPVHGPISSLPP